MAPEGFSPEDFLSRSMVTRNAKDELISTGGRPSFSSSRVMAEVSAVSHVNDIVSGL